MKPFYDIASAFLRYQLWFALAREDMNQRYRRTFFGFVWLTFSFIAFVGVKYFIFSNMNSVGRDFFMVWLVLGYWTWSFITGVTTDGSTVFVNAKTWISGSPLPLPIYAFQSITREFIAWTYTAIAATIVVVLLGFPKGWTAVAALPAIPFFMFTALGVELLVGTLAAGMRDLIQVIKTVMRVAYFLTPILWVPSGRPQLQWVSKLNPFTYYIELIRTPIMLDSVPWNAWITAVSITSAIWILALLVFGAKHKRIIYWL